MQAIGIQLDEAVVRWALVKWDGRKLRTLELCTESLTAQVNPLYIKQKSIPLVSGLSCGNFVIQALSFNGAASRKLLDALILQAETQLHLKPEETITLVVWPKEEKQTTTYTTTLSSLELHLETCKRFGIDPERVSAMPAAYLAFLKWKAPHVKSYFLIRLDQSSTSAIWVENGILQNAHDFDGGWRSLKEAYQEDRKKLISLKEREGIDFSALKSGQYPSLAEEARRFRRELMKLVCSFQCQRPLAFVGETDLEGPFKDFLWESLRECATEELTLNLTADEKLYSGCCGLAIDYLLQRKSPLQFRRGDRTAPSIWQKLGRLSLVLLAASFLFSGTFYTFGSWWLGKREKELVHSLEGWAATKDQALRFELLSAGDSMDQLVTQWLRIIEKNKKEYPFLVKAPRVATFLHWLSNHPLIDSFYQNGDPISFEQIRYQLESYPHLEALQDPYLAKVELEFKLSSPLHARQLHVALLEESVMIDTSREISWDVLESSYRTSFYLNQVSNGFL